MNICLSLSARSASFRLSRQSLVRLVRPVLPALRGRLALAPVIQDQQVQRDLLAPPVPPAHPRQHLVQPDPPGRPVLRGQRQQHLAQLGLPGLRGQLGLLELHPQRRGRRDPLDLLAQQELGHLALPGPLVRPVLLEAVQLDPRVRQVLHQQLLGLRVRPDLRDRRDRRGRTRLWLGRLDLQVPPAPQDPLGLRALLVLLSVRHSLLTGLIM